MHTLPQSTRPLSRIGILHSFGELRVIALERIEPGEAILLLDGLVMAQPTRYTIQIGAREHLGFPTDASPHDLAIQHPWCFLNHSCRPNARVDGRALVGLERIEPFDEVTFDYETTEWRIAEPFPCRCGSCGGRMVRGFCFLDAGERGRRRAWLAPHLLDRGDDFSSAEQRSQHLDAQP